MSAVLPVDEVDERSHPAARAWLRVRPRSQQPRRIDILKPQRHFTAAEMDDRVRKHGRAVFRLHGVLPGGRPVIAKYCRRKTGDTEVLVYELLSRIGVPAPELLDVTVEDDHCLWMFLSDEGDLEWRFDELQQQVLFTKWIASLHALASDSAALACLPKRDAHYYLAMLRLARRRLDGMVHAAQLTSVQLDDLAGVGDALDRLDRHWVVIEQASAAMPETLVHGDLAPKNVRVRTSAVGPSLAVLDWEMTGVGPPGPDLGPDWFGSSDELREQYRDGVRRWVPGLTDAGLVRMVGVGRVFRLIAAISGQTRTLESGWKTEKSVVYLTKWGRQLAESVAAWGEGS
jgi:aminoglycoside phosphotransferase (APT) family kinase protein